ncbi:MAG: transcription antitermination factor NusB, partial [Anaerolineales bacterium]|nr:transcription antitermination factor NusB [Anaerolineales bacterium]
MKDRTRVRGIALQALYELDLTNHPVGTVIQERIADADLDDELVEFLRKIVLGVFPLRKDLDHFIADHAPDWPLDQVAVIDRNIIRIALWEFAVADDIPLKVAINEAVELAKTY